MDSPEANPHRLENFQAWQQARELAVLACERSARPPLRDHAILAPELARALLQVAASLATSHALPAGSPERQAAQREALGACARAESLLHIACGLKLLGARDLDPLVERLTATRKLTHGLLRAQGGGRQALRPSSPGPARRPPASGGGSRGDGPWGSRS